METKCHGDHYPFAHHTALGWALVGSLCPLSEPGIDLKNFRIDHEHLKAEIFFSTKCKPLTVKSCFEENEDDELLGPSREDQLFSHIMQMLIHTNDKGYLTMPLPFRNPNVIMPDNRNAVYHHTKNTLMRLKKDEYKLNQCLSSMNKNLAAGHVEHIPENGNEPVTVGRAWWLPIFVVTHPKKLTARLVYDSSANYHGTSLNNELLQGPDDNNKLRSVLLRFRKRHIGFTADIESMFYNFFLPKDDKDFLRFYWYKNNDPDKNLVHFRGCVHLFRNRPSPAIAHFGLISTINHNYNENVKVKNFIAENFYVDDALGCSRSYQSAINILEGAREILGCHHIRLHKIHSNSEQVVGFFPESERAKHSDLVDLSGNQLHRTLGVAWNTNSDEFLMKVDLPSKPFNRRGIIAVVNSLYDPLGIVNPVTLKGKLIQRKIMLHTKDSADEENAWDTQLPSEHNFEWEKWRSSLDSIESIRLPRSVIPEMFGEIVSCKMHIFSDASNAALGTVAYYRLVDSNNTIHVSYLASASKLVPRCAKSMPRMELCAALEASTLCSELSLEIKMKLDQTFMYTDSMVVLGYSS